MTVGHKDKPIQLPPPPSMLVAVISITEVLQVADVYMHQAFLGKYGIVKQIQQIRHGNSNEPLTSNVGGIQPL